MKDEEQPAAIRRSSAQRAREGPGRLRRSGELPGPFGRSFWRSPIRGPWLTSILGLILLAGLSVVFVTGLLSYAAYNPDLNRINDQTHGKGLLGFYLFSWPTHPVWLYRLNQGVHVTLGLVLIPILLAKLWSVLPKLFEWPPLRSPAHALERLSLLLLVGGVVFEFVTGILNIQQWYTFPGSFYTLHYYGAWVFVAGFAVHVGLKSRTVIRSLRARGLVRELRWPSPEPARCCCSPCRRASRWAARCAAPRCSYRTGRISVTGPTTSRSTRPRPRWASGPGRPVPAGGSPSITRSQPRPRPYA